MKIFVILNCFSIAFVILPFVVDYHQVLGEPICHHKYPKVEDIPHPIRLAHRIKKRDSGNDTEEEFNHQLRIKVFYHKSVEELETVKKRIVKDKVVPNAVKFWEKGLKVRRNLATIHLNRQCEGNQYFLAPNDPIQYCRNDCVETKCGEFIIQDEHLGSCHTCNSSGRSCKKKSDAGKGIEDADFVLYVSAISTKQCGEAIGQEASTVAYAAHCQQEADFDRPIAGHTNICPNAINNTAKEVAGMTSTVQHELLHALGFSSSLFGYFRDENGNPRTERERDGKPPINRRLQIRQWSNNTIRQITRKWKVRSGTINRTVNLVVTPKVREEVRRHFDCPTLEGAELEDQGGDGTSLTHWEKRLFQNEAMTGTVHTQNPIYSRLTFSLLEDSGWYKPNYDLAKELKWGKNLGCDFATKSCMELMEQEEKYANVEYPFCRQLMQKSPKTSCTADRTAVGSCNLAKFRSKIPQKYQNFAHLEGVNKSDLPFIGSSVTLADFCPYVQEFTWKTSGSRARGTRCTNSENNPSSSNNYALESYGQGSRCFEQGSQWEQRTCTALKQWKRYGAGCYNFTCENKMVNIVIRNVTFPCEKEGQILDIRLKYNDWLHEGSLVCPKCEDYCSECQDGQNSTVDLDSLKEDIEGSCFEQGFNSLQDFFSGFGISIGSQ